MTRGFSNHFKGRLLIANYFRLNCLEHTSSITISVLSKHSIGGWEDRIGQHFVVELGFTVTDDIRLVIES